MDNTNKTLTWAQFFVILTNFVGTTIVNIHSVTKQRGIFSAGVNGSLKKADKMVTLLGVNPTTDLVKEQWCNFMLTSCSYGQLIKNILVGSLTAELKELGFTDKEIKTMQSSLKAVDSEVTDYETSDRKNGKSINAFLVESAKDKQGMINCYANIKGGKRYHYMNKVTGDVIDLNDTASIYAPYIKAPKVRTVNPKQAQYLAENGASDLSKWVCVNNFRFESIVDIKINGERYNIVPDKA